MRIPIRSVLLAAFAGALVMACSDNTEMPFEPEEMSLPAATVPSFLTVLNSTVLPQVQTYPLIADGGDAITAIQVGVVKVWNDANYLWVRYELSGDWCFTETHVHVATTPDGVPQRRGNPIPGQFDYPYDATGCESEYTYPPIALNAVPGDDLVIAAHAELYGEQVDLTLVSRPGTDVYGPVDAYIPLAGAWGTPAAAVATWKHSAWPLIPGSSAVWISNTEYIEGNIAGHTWRRFDDTFVMPDDFFLLAASMNTATSDNAEEFYFNSSLVGSDGEVQGPVTDNHEWATLIDYGFTPIPGSNTLAFIVRNYAGSSTPTANPTGLLYEASVSYLSRAESGWAADPDAEIPPDDSDGNGYGFDFEGKNWAMYLQYKVALVVGGWDATRGGSYALPAGSQAQAPRTALTSSYVTELRDFSTLTAGALDGIHIVYLSSVATNGSAIAVALTSGEQTVLGDFVDGGGCAILFPDNNSFGGGGTDAINESLIDPFGLDIMGNSGGGGTSTPILPHPSPVLENVGTIIYGNYWGWFDVAGSSTVLATLDSNTEPSLVEFAPDYFQSGSGLVVVFSDANVFFGGGAGEFGAGDNATLFMNTVDACFAYGTP